MAKDKTHKAAASEIEDSAKDKAVEVLESALEKKYGSGAFQNLGSKKVAAIWPSIPTGIYAVDYKVLGIGGLPRRRICEMFGPEGGGKTTLALQTIAEAQALGGRAAFIDAEHALDPMYAKALGVDLDRFWINQPDNGEQALEIVDDVTRSGAFDIVVVDSVAALVPRAELDGEMGDSNMGLHARLMSQGMRKLTGAVSKSNTCLLFINQIREKIGVMFGNPETTTGGRALKFYASVRLDVRRTAGVKDGEIVVANSTKIKAVKNRMFPPFRETIVDLRFGKGFDKVGSILDTAVELNVVQKSGAWYSMQGERLGQGRESVIEFLTGDKDLTEKIHDLVVEADNKEVAA